MHQYATDAFDSLGRNIRQLRLGAVLANVGFDQRDTDGQGNGLRNVRHRAEHLGGSVTIDSASGRGTRIDLRVPARSEG